MARRAGQAGVVGVETKTGVAVMLETQLGERLTLFVAAAAVGAASAPKLTSMGIGVARRARRRRVAECPVNGAVVTPTTTGAGVCAREALAGPELVVEGLSDRSAEPVGGMTAGAALAPTHLIRQSRTIESTAMRIVVALRTCCQRTVETTPSTLPWMTRGTGHRGVRTVKRERRTLVQRRRERRRRKALLRMACQARRVRERTTREVPAVGIAMTTLACVEITARKAITELRFRGMTRDALLIVRQLEREVGVTRGRQSVRRGGEFCVDRRMAVRAAIVRDEFRPMR